MLALDRSILTENIARRGLHLTSDYTTDPLETFFVKDVVRPGLPPVPVLGDVATEDTLRHAANVFAETDGGPLRVHGPRRRDTRPHPHPRHLGGPPARPHRGNRSLPIPEHLYPQQPANAFSNKAKAIALAYST